MKIAILCFPCSGGSGVLATSLACALADLEHDVHLLSSERPPSYFSTPKNLSYHQVNLTQHDAFPAPDYTLSLASTLARLCEREQIEIVHAHYALPHVPAALLGIDMVQSHRPGLIATLHGTDVTRFGRDPDLAPLLRYSLGRCQAVTAVSDALCQEANELFGLNSQVIRIYNFCRSLPSKACRQTTRDELGISADEIVALHMSNLRSVKRFDRVLTAFAKSKVQKLLVLSGEDFGPYKALVEKLGIQDRVLVKKTNEVERFLEAADLGLYASEQESFGLGILETMTYGKPVVATRVGGVPEVVGETGLLSEENDLEALTRHLTLLHEDTELRQRLAEEAQKRARTVFSKERALDSYLTLYRRYVGG